MGLLRFEDPKRLPKILHWSLLDEHFLNLFPKNNRLAGAVFFKQPFLAAHRQAIALVI
jgi:hypothetical protein